MTATIKRRLALGAVAAAAATGLFATTPPAIAGPCGPRQLIVKDLAASFKETRAAMGLMNTGDLLEIFVSPAGTWTAVVTKPTGYACIVANGDTWMPEAVGRGPEV